MRRTVPRPRGVSHPVKDIGTVQAARILGVSTRLIQKLADSGKLPFWKTPGGHRRLALNSVLELLQEMQSTREAKLPDVISEAPASRAPLNSRDVSEANDMSRAMHPILLVEDHPRDVELTVAAIEFSGIENPVVVVRSGEEALVYFARQAQQADPVARPALLLLDIKMHGPDGFEVLTRIKTDPSLSSIPVVMFTSSSDEADVRRSYEKGANAFITKPTDYREFRGVIENVVSFWTRHNRSMAEYAG